MGDWVVLIFIVSALVVLLGGLALVLFLRNSVLPKYRFQKMFGVSINADAIVKERAIYLALKEIQEEKSFAWNYVHQFQQEIRECKSSLELAKLQKQLENQKRIGNFWTVKLAKARRLAENAGDKTMLESIESRLKAEKDTRLSYVS